MIDAGVVPGAMILGSALDEDGGDGGSVGVVPVPVLLQPATARATTTAAVMAPQTRLFTVGHFLLRGTEG